MEILKKYKKKKFLYLESVLTLGIILILFLKQIISFENLLIIFLVLGIIFSLFHGIQGTTVCLISLFIAIILKIFIIKSAALSLNEVFSKTLLLLIFANIITQTLVGIWAESFYSERENFLQLTETLKNHSGFILSHLISIEQAYREIFRKTFGLIGEPRFFYHEMRALIKNILTPQDLFKEIFFKLEKYFEIEGGIVYYRDKNCYKEISRFGISKLPENISFSDLPDWLYLVENKKEIVVPNNIEKAGIMIAIPITITFFEKPLYVFVVERINYTQLTETTLRDLEVIALCIKIFLEKRFYTEHLKDLSLHPTILVYKEDVAKRILFQKINIYKKAHVPFKIGEITFSDMKDLLKNVEKVQSILRETDEMFQIGNHLVILFFMATDFFSIQEKLKTKLFLDIKEIKNLNDYGFK